MNINKQLAYLIKNIRGLSVYHLFSGGPGRRIAGALNGCLNDGEGMAATVSLPALLFRELACWAETSGIPPAGNLWQNFLLDQIILSDNAFTRTSAAGPPNDGSLAVLLHDAAREDLLSLQCIIDPDFTLFCAEFDQAPLLKLLNKPLNEPVATPNSETPAAQIYQLKKKLLGMSDWKSAPEALKEFHRQSGCGLFCRYRAFRWDGRQKILSGIANPDPVRLENMIGYEDERSQVIQNTERLLSGLPAGNMLLYGDRGTGKSSTVKALLHRYGQCGLRIIEIPRNDLGDFHVVMDKIKNTGLSFILFVDDLSYEESETDYKDLKSILDGSLQARPENVVIYATSNRRHLVREYFDERQGDVHSSDTLQEKLSLSERFAVTVLFLSPDQELYLSIVEGLARQKDISLPPMELRLLALEWEKWNNGRSGRTASQFVESLVSAT